MVQPQFFRGKLSFLKKLFFLLLFLLCGWLGELGKKIGCILLSMVSISIMEASQLNNFLPVGLWRFLGI